MKVSINPFDCTFNKKYIMFYKFNLIYLFYVSENQAVKILLYHYNN